MRIIEIKALDNGGHRNQNCNFSIPIPEGWAVIPEDMETPNFPFGEIETKDEDIIEVETVTTIEIVDDVPVAKDEEVSKIVGTRKVVTKWTAGVVPEDAEPEQPASDIEQLRADIEFVAIMTGVEL